MSFFDVYQLECSKKNIFNIQVNRLIRVTAKIDFLFKISLQSLDFNVFATRISISTFTKRKRTTKKLNFERQDRKSKSLLETIQNKNVKRKKTTKNMLLIREIQHNETLKKKKRRWHDEKKKRHQRMCDRIARKNQTFFTSLSLISLSLKKSNVDFLSSSFDFLDVLFSSFSSSSSLLSVLCEISSTMSHDDWELIARFYSALNDLFREECNVCNEIEFAIQLKSFDTLMKCHRCRANKKKNLIMISLFEKINNMNFFLLSSHLSRLSIAKKLFIVRVHVFMNLRRVKDCQ
jgi:hypothetical protein